MSEHHRFKKVELIKKKKNLWVGFSKIGLTWLIFCFTSIFFVAGDLVIQFNPAICFYLGVQNVLTFWNPKTSYSEMFWFII